MNRISRDMRCACATPSDSAVRMISDASAGEVVIMSGSSHVRLNVEVVRRIFIAVGTYRIQCRGVDVFHRQFGACDECLFVIGGVEQLITRIDAQGKGGIASDLRVLEVEADEFGVPQATEQDV